MKKPLGCGAQFLPDDYNLGPSRYVASNDVEQALALLAEADGCVLE